jgi:hypothetical protein
VRQPLETGAATGGRPARELVLLGLLAASALTLAALVLAAG